MLQQLAPNMELRLLPFCLGAPPVRNRTYTVVDGHASSWAIGSSDQAGALMMHDAWSMIDDQSCGLCNVHTTIAILDLSLLDVVDDAITARCWASDLTVVGKFQQWSTVSQTLYWLWAKLYEFLSCIHLARHFRHPFIVFNVGMHNRGSPFFLKVGPLCVIASVAHVTCRSN